MQTEEAFKNLAMAARAYRGTWDDHQALHQSLQVIAKAVGLSAQNATPVTPGAGRSSEEAKRPTR